MDLLTVFLIEAIILSTAPQHGVGSGYPELYGFKPDIEV